MNTIYCPNCRSNCAIRYEGVIVKEEAEQNRIDVKVMFACLGELAGCDSLFYVILENWWTDYMRGLSCEIKRTGRREWGPELEWRDEIILESELR